MRKNIKRGIVVAILAVLTVGIVIIGRVYSQSRIYEGEEVNITRQANANKQIVEEVSEQIKTLYKDGGNDYLAFPFNEELMTSLQNKITGIQTTAEDFGVKSSELPSIVNEYASKKKELEKELRDIQTKFRVQNVINENYEQPIGDFSEPIKFDEQQPVKEIHNADITALKDSLKNLSTDSEGWKKSITQCIDDLEEQYNIVKTVKEKVDTLWQNKAPVGTITQSNYDELAQSIASIRNEALRKEYRMILNEMASYVVSGKTQSSDETSSQQEANQSVSASYSTVTPRTSGGVTGENNNGGGASVSSPQRPTGQSSVSSQSQSIKTETNNTTSTSTNVPTKEDTGDKTGGSNDSVADSDNTVELD